MNTAKQNKTEWIKQFNCEQDFFHEYETLFPPFENWDRNAAAEQSAWLCLDHAWTLLYASAPRELSDKFLKWSIAVVDRALVDGKFSPENRWGFFPLNRGVAYRTRAYARALLENESLKSDGAAALADLESIAEEKLATRLDSLRETYITNPARLALILKDFEAFERLLPCRRRIKWHQEEAELVLALAKAARAGEPVDDATKRRFVQHFDRVRSPDFRQQKDYYHDTELVRFELGILYCQLIETSEPFSWRRVIDAVSR